MQSHTIVFLYCSGFGNKNVIRTTSDNKYHAGNQKFFLKRGSGIHMSLRASRLAQQKSGNIRGTASTGILNKKMSAYRSGLGPGRTF